MVAASIALFLALAEKAACMPLNAHGDLLYTPMCFNDPWHLYTARGYAELHWPFADSGGRYRFIEYPVLMAVFQYAVAWMTHLVTGRPDLEPRAALSPDQVASLDAVGTETIVFTMLTMVFLAVLGVVAARVLWSTGGTGSRSALLYATAPALVFCSLVNWELLAVLFSVLALWAWSRDRPALAGVMIGLGCATKLYPVFLLWAVLVWCVRESQLPKFVRCAVAAAVAWLAVNLPIMLTSPEGWWEFWRFSGERGADLGSVWTALSELGAEPSERLVSVCFVGGFVVACLAVLVAGTRLRNSASVAQLGLLVTLAFLMLQKVYSPQYVLWLLPLAVLAVPRWRLLLGWQLCELFYFGAVLLHVGGYTDRGGGTDWLYVGAILLRLCGQVWLGWSVVRMAWGGGGVGNVVDTDPRPAFVPIGGLSRL